MTRASRKGTTGWATRFRTDYCFLGHLSVLSLVHMNSGAIHAILGPKGVNAYMIKTAVAAIENWGLGKIVLKNDQEQAFTALVREIKTAQVTRRGSRAR